MKLFDLLNYVIVAVVLVAIGYAIKTAKLWSLHTTVSIPFICFTLATVLMIVAVICLVCQKPLSELPRLIIITVCAVFIVISGIGVLVYYLKDWSEVYSHLMNLLEWIEASVILVLVFILPKLKQK